MLSVGIDVSKEKSTVCAMRYLGEIVFAHLKLHIQNLTYQNLHV